MQSILYVGQRVPGNDVKNVIKNKALEKVTLNKVLTAVK